MAGKQTKLRQVRPSLIHWSQELYTKEGLSQGTYNSYMKDCGDLLEVLLAMFDSDEDVKTVFEAYGFKTKKTGYRVIKDLKERADVSMKKRHRTKPREFQEAVKQIFSKQS